MGTIPCPINYVYMRGATLRSLRCVVFGKKLAFHTIFHRFSVVIASVGVNIDRLTTQHTTKCAENCSDNKVSYNCPSNSYQIFCKLGYNSENNVFFSTVDKLFVLKRCIPCAQTVTLR